MYSTDEKFFASRGDSLTESDATPSHALSITLSQSSEFDDFKSEKEFPESILMIPNKDFESSNNSSGEETFCPNILPNCSILFKAFSLWKHKFQLKNNGNTRQQMIALQEHLNEIQSKIDQNSIFPNKIRKNLQKEEIIFQLKKKNELILQIERQKEINISLKKQLIQLKKESKMLMSNSGGNSFTMKGKRNFAVGEKRK